MRALLIARRRLYRFGPPLESNRDASCRLELFVRRMSKVKVRDMNDLRLAVVGPPAEWADAVADNSRHLGMRLSGALESGELAIIGRIPGR